MQQYLPPIIIYESDRWLGDGRPATRVPGNYFGLHGVNLEVVRCTNTSGKHWGVYGAPVGVICSQHVCVCVCV